MKVRLPQTTDLLDWLALVKDFLGEGVDKYGFGYDQQSAEQAFFVWQNNPRTISFVLEHDSRLIGCISGITSPHYFNANNWYYYEHLWVVAPEFRGRGGGIRLLLATIGECERRGIKHLIMANQKHFKAEEFNKMYQKLGFEPMEQLWIRKV